MLKDPQSWNGIGQNNGIVLGIGRWALSSLVVMGLFISSHLYAQQPFPVPRLTTLTPCGAKKGTTVEVVLAGADLDEVDSLHFSNSGFKAEWIKPPPRDPKDKKAPPPPPLQFKITVPDNMAPGIYDVRAIGKWGISNPRAFTVGELNWVMEKEPNNDVPQAQKVELGSVVHGIINPKPDVDYFVFQGKKGQHVVLHAAAFSIDSRLNPQLRVFNPQGKEIAASLNYRHREAVVDCVLPVDGDYHVRLCEFTYLSAGPEYFYCLSISESPWIDAVYPPAIQGGKTSALTLFGRNLPGADVKPASLGKMVLDQKKIQVDASSHKRDQLRFGGTLWPRSGSLDGFELRVRNPAGPSNPALVTFVDHPVILDNQDNASADKAQEIILPVELCGRIEKPRDRDWYAFSARKGEVYVLEGFADRLRAPMDLYFQIRKQGTPQILGEFDDHPDIAPTAGKFFTRTDDPKTRWVVPEDGKYELMVRSRTADLLGGPRHVYRLSIRKEQPDFNLLVVGNNDASAGGCTVRRGGSQDLEIVCFRQDGFEGEVLLNVEGLPPGVSCPPQVLGPRADRTTLVVTAPPNTPLWTGAIRVTGTAEIEGAKVVREGRAGCIVWPSPNNVPSVSRLARTVCLAVREKGPYSLTTPLKELAVPVGGNVAVKVKVTPLWPDFKVPVQIDSVSGPVQTNRKLIPVPKLTIAAGKSDGEIKMAIPNATVPGTYNLVFRGLAKYPYTPDPKIKKKTNLDVTQVTPPIKMVVFDKVAELSVANPKLVVKAGAEIPLIVKLKRLHDYRGDYKVQVVLPKGAQGLTVADVTVPPGADSAKLIIKAAQKIKPATLNNIQVRATAKLDKITLTTEIPFSLQIVDAKSTAANQDLFPVLVGAFLFLVDEQPATVVRDVSEIRTAARDLLRNLDFLEEDIVETLSETKDKVWYRKVELALDSVDRFEKSLKSDASRADLYRDFDQIDAKVEELLKGLGALRPNDRAFQRTLSRVRSANEELLCSIALEDTNEKRQRQVLDRQIRLLVPACQQLEATARYALADNLGTAILMDHLRALRKTGQVLEEQAGKTDSYLDEAASLTRAWEIFILDFQKLPIRDSVFLLRSAVRVDRIHGRIFRLTGMKGKCPVLTIRL